MSCSRNLISFKEFLSLQPSGIFDVGARLGQGLVRNKEFDLKTLKKTIKFKVMRDFDISGVLVKKGKILMITPSKFNALSFDVQSLPSLSLEKLSTLIKQKIIKKK